MPAPLPHTLPSRYDLAHTIRGAYAILREYEDGMIEGGAPDTSKELIYVRILGYLLLYGPDDIAQANVAREVVAAFAKGKSSVFDLGKFYLDHYIRCCE
jgi:hypothetical protein